MLVAARAAGIQAIDGPYLAIRDADGLRARAEHVRALGFDGKWAVHPEPAAAINAAFTPAAGGARARRQRDRGGARGSGRATRARWSWTAR